MECKDCEIVKTFRRLAYGLISSNLVSIGITLVVMLKILKA